MMAASYAVVLSLLMQLMMLAIIAGIGYLVIKKAIKDAVKELRRDGIL